MSALPHFLQVISSSTSYLSLPSCCYHYRTAAQLLLIIDTLRGAFGTTS